MLCSFVPLPEAAIMTCMSQYLAGSKQGIPSRRIHHFQFPLPSKQSEWLICPANQEEVVSSLMDVTQSDHHMTVQVIHLGTCNVNSVHSKFPVNNPEAFNVLIQGRIYCQEYYKMEDWI